MRDQKLNPTVGDLIQLMGIIDIEAEVRVMNMTTLTSLASKIANRLLALGTDVLQLKSELEAEGYELGQLQRDSELDTLYKRDYPSLHQVVCATSPYSIHNPSMGRKAPMVFFGA